MNKSLTLLFLATTATAFAERQPYARYETIVDRQMFGPLPPGFDPSKMPSEVAKGSSREEKELTQEQEQVKKAIRFSVINVTPAGETVVGFSDNGDLKNPLHYYLKVGESQNGWTVKEADPQAATMTVVKGEVEVTLKLGGETGGAPARSEAAAGTAAGGSRVSFRERRQRERQQLEASAAKMAEEAKAREAREAEEKQQREAERAEQREQLLRIQEELRKAREARESQKEAEDPQPEG